VAQKAKVIGIGFHKTATTSLRVALELLGYTVTGPNWVDDPDIRVKVHDLARRELERYDAVQDNPWPILFKEIDGWYPGSKFVLTVRPTASWLRSSVKYFGTETTPMREWIYGVGSPVGNEAIYVERYERHNREVAEYFRDRPGDLLLLDITRGDGWDKLCPFLGVSVPSTPFPHENAAPSRKGKLVAKLRRALKARTS
jgi:sulfotransferase family protein